jgi:opacity protein-like surface antigen
MTRFWRFSASVIGMAAATAAWTGVACAADVQAGDPANYISLFGGYTDGFGHSHIDNDLINFRTDGGFLLGGALGTHFAPNWRIESELSFISNGFDTGQEAGNDPNLPINGRVRSVLFMGNVWKDFDLGIASPYVGGGLGSGFINARGNAQAVSGDASWDDTSLALAGQLGAGVRIPLSDRLTADLGYRFKAIYAAGLEGTTTFGGTPDENANFAQYIHAVQIGATYAFGPQTIPAPASGDGDWYASVFGGLALPEDTAINYSNAESLRHKSGFTLGAAIGTRITPRLRAEAELSFLSKRVKNFGDDSSVSDPASGDLNQFYLMANMWHDIPMGSVSPYFGGGLGFGFIDANGVNLDGDVLGDKTGVGLAAQVGAGVRAQFSDSLAVDVGYRLKSIIEANVGAANGTDGFSALTTVDHVLQASLTYGFNGSPIVQDDGQLGNWYVSVFGGGMRPANNHISNYYDSDYYARYKTGYTVGVAVGREVADNLRAELELSYAKAKIKDSQIQSLTFDPETGSVATTYVMANLWHDWDLGSFSPYGGFGVGAAFTNADYTLGLGSNLIDDSTVNLAAQVGTGVRISLTDNALLDVGYRLKVTAGVLSASTNNSGYAFNHNFNQVVQAGVTWKF